MPTVIETKIYQFSELSDDAKERARDWYRSVFYFDPSPLIDCIADIADMFGLDIRQTYPKPGRHDYTPTVYYSGFYSQGDGACFEGVYRYKKGALAAVKKEYPQDTELHRIVKGLQDVQAKHFYQLRAKTGQRGHYSHSGCMWVEAEHLSAPYLDIDYAEGELRQLLRDFADWIYKALQGEYEGEQENDYVDENIVTNEYTFTEDGRRFG